jgi:hypothetical protein
MITQECRTTLNSSNEVTGKVENVREKVSNKPFWALRTKSRQ